MIITVQLPFGVPGAGTNSQSHPQASKKERDCWTVERGEGRDTGEEMEDSLAKKPVN